MTTEFLPTWMSYEKLRTLTRTVRPGDTVNYSHGSNGCRLGRAFIIVSKGGRVEGNGQDPWRMTKEETRGGRRTKERKSRHSWAAAREGGELGGDPRRGWAVLVGSVRKNRDLAGEWDRVNDRLSWVIGMCIFECRD